MHVNNFIIITVKWSQIYCFMTLLRNNLVSPRQLSCNLRPGSGPSCDRVTPRSCSSLVWLLALLPIHSSCPYRCCLLLALLRGGQGEKWRGGESSYLSWGPSLVPRGSWVTPGILNNQHNSRRWDCPSAALDLHILPGPTSTWHSHTSAVPKFAGSELAREEETAQRVKKLAYRTHMPKEDLHARTRGKQALGKLPVTLSYSICLFKTTGNYQGNALL